MPFARAAPADEDILVDDDYLDTIAEAFGQVIDAKCPFTARHSAQVAELAAAMGEQMNLYSVSLNVWDTSRNLPQSASVRRGPARQFGRPCDRSPIMRSFFEDRGKEKKVTKNPRTRFLPLVILPAIVPAVLLPVLRSSHISDTMLGGTMGVFIGLAIVSLVWMIKGNACSSSES